MASSFSFADVAPYYFSLRSSSLRLRHRKFPPAKKAPHSSDPDNFSRPGRPSLPGATTTGPTLVELLFTGRKSMRAPVWIGVMVNLSMQLSGIDAVLYYSTNVFENAGIDLEWAQVCTTLVGLVNVVVTIPAMLFMDVAGRKTIQCCGLGGMCVSYCVMVYSMVGGTSKTTNLFL